MAATRSRKQLKAYDRHLRDVEPADTGCAFCAIGSDSSQLVAETPHFKILQNLFPYSVWDAQTVADHLLLIPKLHTDTLADLSPETAQEFVKLLSSYESTGYNVYARAPDSVIKTVAHQHTHLIKPGKKRVKLLLYVHKPYLRAVIK